ncbi:MAG TPA: PHP domain-containing protein [Gemmatimonadales bacterium]|nr:PHP domain-containing protein [Gemmatimonadales bacterium]
MDRTGVARALDQMAAILELKGENPFRVRAFRTAARSISTLPGDLHRALEDGSLAATKGIGPALLQIVSDLARTNRSEVYDTLLEEVPPGLVEMLSISGLGVAKVRLIHERLGVETLGELEQAVRDGRLARVPGFGPRSAANVLRGVQFLRRQATYRLIHHAWHEAEAVRAALEQLPGVTQAITAGDVRRRMELVRDLVVVLVAEVPPAQVLELIGHVPGVDEYAGQDERRATLRFAGGSLVQVIVTPPVNLGTVLVQATGNEAHVSRLAELAKTRGYSLQGTALWRGSEFVPTPTEQSLYAALGLPEIPPELREGRNEFELAAAGLPRLVEPGDLRGFVHCHTSFSDGSSSIEELALACRNAGFEYLGITDHSSSSAYVGGLGRDDLERQWAEVDAVNQKLAGIRVLKGIEVDILEDGTLDYGDEVLRRFEFVIGAVHSRFTLEANVMTDRLLRAMDSPWMTIMGHPTGRLLLARDSFPVHLEPVYVKAAEQGIALEINADPHRLDLDWRLLDDARKQGVTISIGADAHSAAGLENMTWGVGLARKGGLGPHHILNTREVDGFLEFAARRHP